MSRPIPALPACPGPVLSAAMAAVLTLGALSGCARYEARPVSLTDHAAALDARSLTNADLHGFLQTNLGPALVSWPPASWDFETLNWVAFHYHPSLAIARAQWNTATAGRITAAGRPNPSVTATPGYDFTSGGGLSPWIPGVSFDVPVETAGKRGKRMAQAAHLAEAARLALASSLWQVRSRVRTSFLDQIAAEQRRELLQSTLEIQQRVTTLLEQRLQAGAATTFEVSASRIAQVRLESDVSSARRLAVEAQHALAEALGVPAAALIGATLRREPFDSGPADPARARAIALQQRSDIRAALATYEASQAGLQLEIARQYPDVRLGSGYQWDQGDSKWNLSLSLELPLLNRHQGPIAEAAAKRQEAGAQLLALQARAMAEIDRAAATRVTAEEQLRRLQALRTALTAQRERIEARLRNGGADQLEAQNAALEEQAAAIAVLDAASQLRRASGQLEDTLQIPFPALEAAAQGQADQARKESK